MNYYLTVLWIVAEAKTVDVLLLKPSLRRTALKGKFMGYFSNFNISLWLGFLIFNYEFLSYLW